MKFYCAKCGKPCDVPVSDVTYRRTKNKREQAVGHCGKHGKVYKIVKTGTALRRSTRKSAGRKSGRKSSRKRS